MPLWYMVIQAVSSLVAITSMAYSWRNAQQSAARDALDSVRAKCDDNEHKLLQCEESLRHIPTPGEMSALKRDVGILIERTQNISGWLETTNRKLERIDDWLRENK